MAAHAAHPTRRGHRRRVAPAQPGPGHGQAGRGLQPAVLRPGLRPRPQRRARRHPRLAGPEAGPCQRRLRADRAGPRPGHRRGWRPRHLERPLGRPDGRRHRAQLGHRGRGGRGPRRRVRRALHRPRGVDQRGRRPGPAGGARHQVRPDPHRLHRHPQRQRGPGLRAGREQPLHARGVRRVPRPPDPRRHPQRLPPRAPGGRRGHPGHRPHAGRAGAEGHRAPRAEHRGHPRPGRDRARKVPLRDDPGPAHALDRGRAAHHPGAGHPQGRRRGLRARRPLLRGLGRPGRGVELAGLLRRLPARHLPADRRPAVLLQHAALRRRARRAVRLPLRRRPLPDAAADPGGAGGAGAGRLHRPAAAVPLRRAARAAQPRLLRCPGPRVPAAGDRADPALRAVPRVPDLRAVRRAVRPADLHGDRLGHRGPAAPDPPHADHASCAWPWG